MKWGVLIGLIFIGIIISSFSSKNSSDTGSEASSPSRKSLSASNAEAAYTRITMKINNSTSDVYGIGHDLPRYCFMWLPIRNDIAFLVISIFALFVTGCGESKVTSPSKPPDEILVEETQAEKIAKEQRMREYEEEKSKLESNLKKMTANKAQSILRGCKSALLQLAKSQNKSPFDVFLVDEYSADVYQGAAYAEGGGVSIESEEGRLKHFLEGVLPRFHGHI